jgi:pimeloyl-ACP methyl ester carboxylesterase
MVDVPETRYARADDGVCIAYQVIGDGPFDLVLVPGFVSNVEHYWEMPVVPEMFRRVASFARLILWDKRGTGLSDPVAGVPPLEQRMGDLRAVMDAAESGQAALLGISEGGPMSLLFAATHPERTRALVLYGTTPRFSNAPDIKWGWDSGDLERMFLEVEDGWGRGALLEYFAPSAVSDAHMQAVWGRFERSGASPAMARSVLQALAEIDVRPIVETIHVPTLIIHRTRERVAAVEGARFMGARIPDAKLVELPGEDHLPFVGDWQAIVDEAEEFLTGTKLRSHPQRVLATVLFTDIVDSTSEAARLGDRMWREVLGLFHLASAEADKLAADERVVALAATGSWPLSTGRAAPSIARWRSSGPRPRSEFKYGPACTPASARREAMMSADLRSTSAPGSPRSRHPARFWPRAR